VELLIKEALVDSQVMETMVALDFAMILALLTTVAVAVALERQELMLVTAHLAPAVLVVNIPLAVQLCFTQVAAADQMVLLEDLAVAVLVL
jgi:hypothetical protein